MTIKKKDNPKSKEPEDHSKAKMKLVSILESFGWDIFPEAELHDKRTRDAFYKKNGHRIRINETIYTVELLNKLDGKNILLDYPVLNDRINNPYKKRNDIAAIDPQTHELFLFEVQDIVDSIHGKPRVMNRDINSVLRIIMMYPQVIIIHVGKGWINATDEKILKKELKDEIQNWNNPLFIIADRLARSGGMGI